MTAVPPELVGDGVHRVADGLVNWYVVEEDGRLALFDVGWPRSWPTIEGALAALGRSPGDVEAIVLTHAHPDHMGAAERARKATGAPVWVHREENPRLRGESKEASPVKLVPALVPQLRRGRRCASSSRPRRGASCFRPGSGTR
ncbi:MAG: hypothetical protein AVDCRST_MAG45-600 [uncultured Solirubrobacterales bacterium]|uniref:Metallo-beta-lactamase domain-containing protein n=1 Tax=uncultured Solirubrobacterales bacterium TaxID=768556 RepID=A0A6J4S4D0_9ACTN|nr:MAG: hypothetical protein AVDCRST_MAG45-600 [uncultured Solirubrobacterales bacterium]